MPERIKLNNEYTQFMYDSIPDFPKKVSRSDLLALSDLYFGVNNYELHTLSDALERLKKDGVIFLPERGRYARPTDFRQLAHSFRRHVRPVTRRSLLLAEEIKAERLRRQLRKTLATQKDILGTAGTPKRGRPINARPPDTPATRTTSHRTAPHRKTGHK